MSDELCLKILYKEGKDMLYLTTHSTHFIYGYMASDIWLRTILIVRKETRCRHMGYSFRLAARVLLYASFHRQDNTYHNLCDTSRGALAETRNSLMGPPWRFDPTTYRTMSERSYHGATSRSVLYKNIIPKLQKLKNSGYLAGVPEFRIKNGEKHLKFVVKCCCRCYCCFILKPAK